MMCFQDGRANRDSPLPPPASGAMGDAGRGGTIPRRPPSSLRRDKLGGGGSIPVVAGDRGIEWPCRQEQGPNLPRMCTVRAHEAELGLAPERVGQSAQGAGGIAQEQEGARILVEGISARRRNPEPCPCCRRSPAAPLRPPARACRGWACRRRSAPPDSPRRSRPTTRGRIRPGEGLVPRVEVEQLLVGNIGFGQQHVHVPRHPSGPRGGRHRRRIAPPSARRSARRFSSCCAWARAIP